MRPGDSQRREEESIENRRRWIEVFTVQNTDRSGSDEYNKHRITKIRMLAIYNNYSYHNNKPPLTYLD